MPCIVSLKMMKKRKRKKTTRSRSESKRSRSSEKYAPSCKDVNASLETSSSRWLARQKFTIRGNTLRAVITCALAAELAARTTFPVTRKVRMQNYPLSKSLISRSTIDRGLLHTESKRVMMMSSSSSGLIRSAQEKRIYQS